MSFVRVMPTIFCNRAEPPEPGICPSFCSGSAYCVVSDAIRKSHASESSKTDAEAVATVGDDHRLGAARWRRDVPGELRDVFGTRLHETADVAAAGEMLALRPQHDDANARILVERLERQPELIALRHRHNVIGRAAKDNVGTLMRFIDLDLEPVELGKAGISKCVG